MDMSLTLETGSFIIGLLVYGVAIIKFLIDRIDLKVSREAEVRKELEDSLRKDIEVIKDNHVRRDDHNRHVEAVERQITNVTSMVATMGQNINARLDNLVQLLASAMKVKE